MTTIRVGLVSDTHGYVDPFLFEAFAGVDAIVHGGDVGDPGVIEALDRVAPVTACRGNIDGGPLQFLPLEPVVVLRGLRVGARHICGSPFRPHAAAVDFIRRERLDLLVAGHAHIPVVQRVAGALWINPGAAGIQGFHTSRHAMLVSIGADACPELARVDLQPRWPA